MASVLCDTIKKHYGSNKVLVAYSVDDFLGQKELLASGGAISTDITNPEYFDDMLDHIHEYLGKYRPCVCPDCKTHRDKDKGDNNNIPPKTFNTF